VADNPRGQTAGNESGPQFRVEAPQVSLPKGGGAIRGIGEKFAANPVTGTGSMTAPIYSSPGRSGFGPKLSLSYDSGSGNGPFGFGWSLSLPAITRKTDKGLPQYADAIESDLFLLSGAEDLTPVLIQSGGNWIRDITPSRNAFIAGGSCDAGRYLFGATGGIAGLLAAMLIVLVRDGQLPFRKMYRVSRG
jgi:hypothetical protein